MKCWWLIDEQMNVVVMMDEVRWIQESWWWRGVRKE